MSYTETPEQRQIRILRNSISSMRGDNDRLSSQNRRLEREMELVRRQQQLENERMAIQMRQLQQQERAARTAALQALDAEVKEKERLQSEKIRAMQTQHAAQMQQLQSQFQSERQGLREEIHQSRAELRTGLAQLRTETDEKLRQQRTEHQAELAQLNSKWEGQLSQVDQKVNALAQQIVEREQGQRELAVYWSQEAERLVRQLRENFRDQLLDRRRMTVLERKIRQAQEDIQGGQYQSAITAGRDAFFDALDSKEDLAAAELEWNYWFNAVKTREAQLLESLDAAQHRVYTIPMDGEEVEEDSGIDYWTYGQLSITQTHIDQLRQQLTQLDNATTTELQERVEQIRGLQEELALVENAAHINVAMSLSRFETASKIGHILDENYEMIDSDGDFFSEENREEYHAIFQNPVTRDQMAVVITPLPDEAGVVTNHVELIVGNADNNPVTRDRIAQEVAEKLRASGVEGCAFPCARRYATSPQWLPGRSPPVPPRRRVRCRPQTSPLASDGRPDPDNRGEPSWEQIILHRKTPGGICSSTMAVPQMSSRPTAD